MSITPAIASGHCAAAPSRITLHAVDGQHRDSVEVSAGIAAVAGAKQVDQRRGVLALAVDQYQRLVGPSRRQRRGVHQVSAIGAGLASS